MARDRTQSIAAGFMGDGTAAGIGGKQGRKRGKGGKERGGKGESV